mgnify:FL=1
MSKIIKKADIVLFVCLVLAGAVMSLAALTSGKEGANVVITVDGSVYGTYPLSEDREITVSRNGHMNKITIKDNTVQMSEADCSNRLCIKTGRISRTNEAIVCLPNRVMVKITGGDSDVDVIT